MEKKSIVRLHVFGVVCLSIVAAGLSEKARAERTVFGYVKEQGTGRPMAGLLVEAWDDDPDVKGVSKDDFMGSAHTNKEGYYRINYRGGHWDPSPSHSITTWRPDIYIKVKARSILTSDPVTVYRSSVKANQRLRNDLRIDAPVAPGTIVSRRTQFNPFWHGWPFANDPRKICFAPSCDKEHWLAKHTRKVTRFDWALCGGMSLSALRHFRNGAPVVDFSPKVKEALVNAQLDTVGPSVWFKFLEWQAKPTKPHALSPHTIGFSTKEAWSTVHKAIDRGAPIVLGLIRQQADNLAGMDAIEALQKVGKNHQVLAIGYDYHQLTKDAIIWSYDPNFPRALSKISFNLGLPDSQIKIEQRTYWATTNGLGSQANHIRGFFAIGDSSGPPKGHIVQPTAQQQADFQTLVGLLRAKDAGVPMTR